jgi:hypothetical protein
MSAPDLSDLFARSLSARELVLSAADAIVAIDRLERAGVKILGWEGWLQHADGSRGHDPRAQGTADLCCLSVGEAAEFCRRTILESAKERGASPEQTASRFYCITY